ncbi:acyl-CoA Delta(11) desaturase-like [Galleria mellonella]|uniref:Acyl-CoA Delta(11) desaturase-like n=1 Tax=Galleria mellonella TaxID=7137 RepID=A0A6J1WAK4_GALME|nr:acyl-CoA Delta(11) desaturase-like [Galleria mellonella]
MNNKIHQPSLSELFREFEKSLGFKNEIKWFLCIAIILYHLVGIYWCYHYAFPVKWQTLVFALVMYVLSGFGITGGAHRLWTHKSYKAKLPMKILLLTCFATAGQNSLKQWVRDHRVHHKYSDTDADPHNANRGLFFSHIGWLMMKKNELVLLRGKQIDMSDIENDPLLNSYERYFGYLKLMFCYILPTTAGIWLWNENWRCAVAWQCFIRFLGMFHSELTVNSLAHIYGYKPYNKNIPPSENRFVATCTLGEGWHNYHHAFPFDYKAAEHFDILNITTWLIRLGAKIGWVYDLKEATPQMINSIANRLGDGTPVHFPLPKDQIDNDPHKNSVISDEKNY